LDLKEKISPLKFQPILLKKIWGGQKLHSLLGKGARGSEKIGESWELSGLPSNPSIISEGQFEGESLLDLIEKFKDQLLGKKVYSGFKGKFPLLFKFIDAAEDLSIQVHPKQDQADPKTEMWYIIQADSGSTLFSGFSKNLTGEDFQSYFENGQLLDILNRDEVNEYDAFYLPSGRIHTIGKGLLLAEIQQSSDTTYRIYDFDRVDDFGKKRELHVNEARSSLDFSEVGSNRKHVPPKIGSSDLIFSPFFNTRIWKASKEQKQAIENGKDSFLVLMTLKGGGSIRWKDGSLELKKGETTLIPAVIEKLELITDTEIVLLETWIP
jgi:mannose-6-phosphate isomerase